MSDEQIKELISAYLDGELSVEERAQVERHLTDSVECQQFLDHLRQQQVALRSLPHHKLRVDLSQRVLQAIELSRPAVSPTLPTSSSPSSIREQTTGRSMRKTWQQVAMAIGTVAALLMVGVYFTSANRNIAQLPNTPKLPDQNPLSPNPPPEESIVETELPPETLVAVREFQGLVKLVLIYDITVTPQGRKNKVLEGLMAKAGIPVNKGIPIDQKLAKKILASRFIGNEKAGAGDSPKAAKHDVEMLFVRGTSKQIDAVYRESKQPNPDFRIGLDLAAAPEDLNIFLQLNKASGLDLAEMKADPKTLQVAGAFPMQFPVPLNSASAPPRTARNSPVVSVVSNGRKGLGREVGSAPSSEAASQFAVADSLLGVVQNALTGPAKPASNEQLQGWNDPNQPGQALFIVRNLSEEAKQE